MTSQSTSVDVQQKSLLSGLSSDAICKNAPYVFMAYFALQFFLRILLSSNMEVDEVQFFGATEFQLLYGNSHPPLYNWLVRIFLELTAWNWHIALPLLKNLLLLGTYLLGFDLVKRMTQSEKAATLGVIFLLFLPQILWQSQVTLAHSVLVTFGVVATLHAFYLAAERNDIPSYAWLTLACAIGTLGKFNYFLFLVALIAATIALPSIRRKLSAPKLAVSILAYILLIAPTLLSVLLNLQQSTERMKKLYRLTDFGKAVDIPYLGIDGLFSLASATLASVGLLLIVMGILKFNQALQPLPSDAANQTRKDYANLFGLVTAIGMGAFAAIVLFGDMHFVHERYLTPLLMTAPFWVALNWQTEKNADAVRGLVRAGLIVMALALSGVAGLVMFGKHALAYPYQTFAQDIQKNYGTNLNILALRNRETGNIAFRIPGSKNAKYVNEPQTVIVIWRGEQKGALSTLADRLGDKYKPVGQEYKKETLYNFFSGRRTSFHAQKFVRN